MTNLSAPGRCREIMGRGGVPCDPHKIVVGHVASTGAPVGLLMLYDLNPTPRLSPDGYVHGKSRYTAGCRCNVCVEANRRSGREGYARRKLARATLEIAS